MSIMVLPRLISELFLELLQRLIQFVLCDQIAAIVAQLRKNEQFASLLAMRQRAVNLTCMTVLRIRHSL